MWINIINSTVFMIIAAIASGVHSQRSLENNTNLTDESAAQDLLREMNDVYWRSATTYRQFSDDTLSPEILMREKLRPFYGVMQKYDWQNFENVLLKRQFEVLLRGAKYPKVDYKFKRATHILKSMSRQKWACGRSNSTKCNLAFVHQIKSIFSRSDDLDELVFYWQAWRNEMPIHIGQALHYYIQYYQKIGSTAEMKPSAVWYDQYEDANLMEELKAWMEAIGPFYRELHAHIRHVLRVRYGDDVIPPSGLIPHHLLEQVTYQAWKKCSVLRNPFPQKKMPNLQAELDNLEFFPFDMVNISAQFFASMGFQNLTEEFMRDNFIEMEAGSAGPDCKSRIFDFGEIELHYCPKVYYKKLLQSHADVTIVQYALAKNNMSVGLNIDACPGFGNAMGEAVILAASSPKHLQNTLGLLQDCDYDEMLNLNRLYRMAVHTLLTVPTYFVHEQLWLDMIDGNINATDYNCHYWNLMQEYMGVEAPLQYNSNTYDMPYKFYEGIVDQYRSTKKILGELLGYQIYRSICLQIGEYQPGNVNKNLDNCDFSNSKQAGLLLSEMMSAGSKKPWREIIKPLDSGNSSQLSATGFLEYFKPLHNWLIDDNQNKNLHIGWMVENKCKSFSTPAPSMPATGAATTATTNAA